MNHQRPTQKNTMSFRSFAFLLPAFAVFLPIADAMAQASKEPPAKPTVIISAEENLAKIFVKLPSRRPVTALDGEDGGLLRAVPWRAIGENGVSQPLVRFSFGLEFKRGSATAEGLALSGDVEPFFVEQRAVQCTVEDCKALLKLIASLEAVKFEKAAEGVKYRAVSAGYGDFRFRKKNEDGKVEILSFVAPTGEVWAPVDLPALKKMFSGLVEQMEGFAKSPQTIFLK